MALSGIVSFINLKNFNFSVLPPQEIFALKPANLRIKVRSKFFELFLVRIRILDSETIIPHLKGEEFFNLTLVFPKRGRCIIPEITISSYFPFYFFKRLINIPVNLEFTVFPYPLKCDISFLLSEGKTKTESELSKGKSYEGELTGVRAYIDGDPLKYIHWKVTAKTSSLKTKEFSPPTGNPVVININDFSGSIEEKISKATYALIKLSRMGNPVGLKAGAVFFKPETGQAHLRRLLNALAFYNADEN